MRKIDHKSPTGLIMGAALAFITIAVFFQVGTFDFITYDDPAYVTTNQQVKAGLSLENFVWAFTSSQAYNWHPLTWLSLMLDSSLFGVNAHLMHLTNLFFHTANVALLFIVLLRMTKAKWPSAFAAALFAIHPLHIQSVAWIAERKDVLSTLFWLLTMFFYARYAERPCVRRYLLVSFAFALGLMSKPMLVTLPVILLLLDYWPLHRFATKGRPLERQYSFGKLFLEKVPLFFLSIVSSIVTVIIQQRSGAVKDIVNYPFDVRVINALDSYVKYIIKMFWPADLSIFYPHPGRSLHLSGAVLPALFLIVITILAIRFARSHGYLLTGWFWYICTLVPVIGLVQVGSQAMADRYTYIPFIGLFIIIAWGVPDLLAGYAFRKKVLAAAAAIILLALAGTTSWQLRYWQNGVTILERAVEIDPNNLFAQANLGVAFLLKKDYDSAITQFNKALQIDPCDGMSQSNIGVAFFRKDKTDQAIVHFEKAIEIDHCDVSARLNLATALATQGKHEQAIKQCDEILRIAPRKVEAIELRRGLISQRQQPR